MENIKDSFFDAITARENSKNIREGNLQIELERIYKGINSAINEGKYSYVFYDFKFSDEAKKFLENKGFVIKWFGGCQRDPANDTTVSW